MDRSPQELWGEGDMTALLAWERKHRKKTYNRSFLSGTPHFCTLHLADGTYLRDGTVSPKRMSAYVDETIQAYALLYHYRKNVMRRSKTKWTTVLRKNGITVL